jgi:hypothetical protein
MKAFISYSLLDSEEYIITLLAEELEEQGFYSETGPYKFNNTVDDETFFKIKSSHLFIGILMPTKAKSSAINQRVINEWEFAIARKIPSILLVEKSMMPNIQANQNANIVCFDKHQPDKAIEFVKKTMQEAQRPLKKDMNKAAAWIFGGLALIELIGFLAKTVKKEQLVAA